MNFSGLKEVAVAFHDKLAYFAMSNDGKVQVHGHECLIEKLSPEYVTFEDDEVQSEVLKLSYFDDFNGEERECVLMFITNQGIVVQTEIDLQVFTYRDIIEEGLFMFSLNDLGKLNHIYRVMSEKL